ncbi:MAG: ABC transporter ATP-binding protein [Betaproteobacteria bacterium]|jgi:putative ABC transport system ATP-binding protein|nr:ABC transporter ATP-binding protein [Betaproteobacteria bacterium]
MPQSLIRLIDIHKQYETAGAPPVPVLHGVTLEIASGEFVCLMGQSGSGKSTLMNILGCLDSPTHGEYVLAGQQVSGLTSDALAAIRNRQLGFVFQGFNLLKRMSAIDNVALPMIYAGEGRAQALQRAQEKLRLTGLADLAQRLPNQLSGGQQQRVAIARALVMNPSVLLADEPTGNLDTATSEEIMDLIQRLNREQSITVVLVTHEPDIARFGQRLIRLKDGRVIFDGPIAQGIGERVSA